MLAWPPRCWSTVISAGWVTWPLTMTLNTPTCASVGSAAEWELGAGVEARSRGAAERRRAVELTAREAQIPWLAAGGLANPEIGTGLFLSACRVRYHLGKVFTKLGITSHAQLSRALSAS
jgi:DNA-binding CsgD family transcriptional regulator